jgi:hypothetical protein
VPAPASPGRVFTERAVRVLATRAVRCGQAQRIGIVGECIEEDVELPGVMISRIRLARAGVRTPLHG